MIDLNYYLKYTRTNETISQTDIQEMSDRYSEQYNESISKFSVLISSDRSDTIYRDDIPYKCLIDYGIKPKEDNLTNQNSREIWTNHSDVFKVGDFIQLENKISKEKEPYLFINHQETKDGYDLGIVRKCNNTLLFYPNESSVLNEVSCIIGKGSISQDTNNFISLPADENLIICPNTINTLKINETTRFILSGDAYIVVGVDKLSNPGLLNIRIKEDQIIEDDNLELGIANYWSHQHVYTVDIQNSDPTLHVNDTLTLNVIATDNSIQVLSPTLSYQSSDINVATVVNGIVTCIAEGTAIITVSYNGVSDSISLIVQSEVIVDNYTVDIVGSTTVKINSNITLTSTVFNNGTIDLNKSVVWEVYNQDGSSVGYVNIVSFDGSSITLKAVNNVNYVNKFIVVRASKSDDILIYDEHIIQIKSIF